MMVKARETVNDIALEVVDNQIRQHNPPETKQTFDRLVSEGITEGEARRLIGRVVTSEMFDILKERKPFNEVRFVKALNALPQLPE